MSSLLHDLRFALRTLLRRPGSTFVLVASLALGIALNIAVFSIFDSMLRAMAPGSDSTFEISSLHLTDAQHAAIRDQLAPWGQVFEVGPGDRVSPDDSLPEVSQKYVSENFFSVLGLRPAAGALFQPGSVAATGIGEYEAVLGYSLWKKRFNGDPGVIGRIINLDHMKQARIIGIAPAGISGMPDPVGIWVAAFRRAIPNLKWTTYVQLKPGVSIKQGRTIIESAVIHLQGIENAARSKEFVRSLAEFRRFAWMVTSLFMLVPGMVLLVACANVSGFLAARADERREELAIRQAIGGNRLRLVRQLLAEGGLLAFAAAALSLLLARWMIDGVSPWLNAIFARQLGGFYFEMILNTRAVFVSAGLAVVTTIGAGLLPALTASRANISPLLKKEASILSGNPRFRYRDLLVVVQLVITFIFLVTAALCSRSIYRNINPSFGFDASRMLVVDLQRASKGKQPASLEFEEILEQVRNIAGVKQATLSSLPPSYPTDDWHIQTPETPNIITRASCNSVRSEYFRMTGALLLKGRIFEEAEMRFDNPVAIISESLAQRVWGKANPLGQSLLLGASRIQAKVIGVVKDQAMIFSSNQILKVARPAIYVPLGSQALQTRNRIFLVIESWSGAKSLTPLLRRMLRTNHPDIEAGLGWTIAEINRDSLRDLEIISVAALGMGILCSLFGAVGVFGAIAQMVMRRMREIGIRMAMGATRKNVLMLVLRRSLIFACVAVALGAPASLAFVHVIGRFTRGDMPAVDSTILAAAGGLILVTVLVASCAPARWATKVDPMVVLRYE